MSATAPLEPGWWVLTTAAVIPADRAVTLTRFGRPVVVWRAGGRIRAAWDGCPHRGASFDGARVRDGQLVCPFHSFAFAADGACTAVPCDGAGASTRGLTLRTIPTRDDHGLLWAWVAESEPAAELPWFPFLDRARTADFAETFDAPWDLVIETMLDYIHLPTVHERSIGARMPMAMTVGMEPSPRGGLVVWKDPRDPGGEGDLGWEAPASWILHLGPTVGNAVFFVPVDARRTYVVFRFAQTFLDVPVLADVVGWVANLFNRRVVAEDRAVIEGAARTLAIHPQNDRLVAADAPIAAFRRARRAWLRGIAGVEAEAVAK